MDRSAMFSEVTDRRHPAPAYTGEDFVFVQHRVRCGAVVQYGPSLNQHVRREGRPIADNVRRAYKARQVRAYLDNDRHEISMASGNNVDVGAKNVPTHTHTAGL
jgi:hypothetical protein